MVGQNWGKGQVLSLNRFPGLEYLKFQVMPCRVSLNRLEGQLRALAAVDSEGEVRLEGTHFTLGACASAGACRKSDHHGHGLLRELQPQLTSAPAWPAAPARMGSNLGEYDRQ